MSIPSGCKLLVGVELFYFVGSLSLYMHFVLGFASFISLIDILYYLLKIDINENKVSPEIYIFEKF